MAAQIYPSLQGGPPIAVMPMGGTLIVGTILNAPAVNVEGATIVVSTLLVPEQVLVSTVQSPIVMAGGTMSTLQSQSNIAVASMVGSIASPISISGGTLSTLQSPISIAGGTMSTLQSPIVMAGGTLSTLQSPIVMAGGTLSTLQSPIVMAGGTVSTLQSMANLAVASLVSLVGSLQSPIAIGGGTLSTLQSPIVIAGGTLSTLQSPIVMAGGTMSTLQSQSNIAVASMVGSIASPVPVFAWWNYLETSIYNNTQIATQTVNATLICASLQNLVVDTVMGSMSVNAGSVQVTVNGFEPNSKVLTSTLVAGSWYGGTLQSSQRIQAIGPLGHFVVVVTNIVSGTVNGLYVTAQQSTGR